MPATPLFGQPFRSLILECKGKKNLELDLPLSQAGVIYLPMVYIHERKLLVL